jgi:AraC-like DNA-binding protein
MVQMEYKKYTPPLALRQYVRYFWSFDSFQPHVPLFYIKSFADKYPRLIFQNLNGFSPICTPAGEKMPVCYLSGIDTKDTMAVVGGCFSHFGVSFYPHALNAFYRIGAHELINEMPDIRLLCNSQVQYKMERAKSHTDRVQILSGYLFDKIQQAGNSEPLVNHIIQSGAITEDIGIHQLLKEYDVSERQLERKFKTAVGISPKKYQRIIRFEMALQLLTSGGYDSLASVAHMLNYTDQSHFIKDFKAFSGMTPLEFSKREKYGSESSSFIYA